MTVSDVRLGTLNGDWPPAQRVPPKAALWARLMNSDRPMRLGAVRVCSNIKYIERFSQTGVIRSNKAAIALYLVAS